jgi:transcriptional regulator with XRE-family HTH domain
MQKIRIQLGERIRALRHSLGWSQEQLGERADLHPTYIGGIERGERNVSLENLQKISSAFKLSIAELFDFPATPNQRKILESKVLILMRHYDQKSLHFVVTVLENFDRWLKGLSPLMPIRPSEN